MFYRKFIFSLDDLEKIIFCVGMFFRILFIYLDRNMFILGIKNLIVFVDILIV